MEDKEKTKDAKYLNEEEFNKELKEQVDSVFKIFQKYGKAKDKDNRGRNDEGEER